MPKATERNAEIKKYLAALNLAYDDKTVLGGTAAKTPYALPMEDLWKDPNDEKAKDKLKAAEKMSMTRADQSQNQVEFLLEEALRLAERALEDSLRFDALNVERLRLRLELIEYDLVDTQNTNEEIDVPYWESGTDQASLSGQALGALAEQKSEVIKMLVNARDGYSGAASDSPQSGPMQAYRASRDQVSEAIMTRQNYFKSLERRSLGATSALTYHQRALIHLLARREIPAKLNLLKLAEIQPGGALDYNGRMTEISDRALQDYYEARGRAKAIETGLRYILQVNETELPKLDDVEKGGRTPIAGLVTWLRRASNALVQARRHDQHHVLRLRVEGTLDQLKVGVPVEVKSIMFSKRGLLRLRGISALASTGGKPAWLDVQITSPKEKLDGSTELPAVAVRLGRVRPVDSPLAADIEGGAPLQNRSPLGKWYLKILDSYPKDVTLDSMILDFHLVSAEEPS